MKKAPGICRGPSSGLRARWLAKQAANKAEPLGIGEFPCHALLVAHSGPGERVVEMDNLVAQLGDECLVEYVCWSSQFWFLRTPLVLFLRCCPCVKRCRSVRLHPGFADSARQLTSLEIIYTCVNIVSRDINPCLIYSTQIGQRAVFLKEAVDSCLRRNDEGGAGLTVTPGLPRNTGAEGYRPSLPGFIMLAGSRVCLRARITS